MAKTALRRFRGLWARGPVESCPQDHNLDALNCEFGSTSVKTRRAFDLLSSFSFQVKNTSVYRTSGDNDVVGANPTRPLNFFDNGDFMDVYRFGVTALETVSGTYNQSGISMFNRFYYGYNVSNLGTGNAKVYNGIHPAFVASSILRDIAGAAVTDATTVNLVTSGGKLRNYGTLSGYYMFTVVYETNTGFIRKPGNWLGILMTASVNPGTKVRVNVPIGPAGTVARHVLVSKIWQGTSANNWFNANVIATTPWYANTAVEPPIELFKLARIPDNTTTTYDISYLDEELLDSADYLNDLMTAVPSGIKFMEYNGRLVILGANDKDVMYVSKSGEPESFNGASGFREIEPGDPSGLKNAIEWRGNLYIFKGRSVTVTSDISDECADWEYTLLDNTIGTSPRGIATYSGYTKAPSDGFLVATQRGILFFNGIFQDRELTWKIGDLWKRINQDEFDKIELHLDPTEKLVYCLVPLDTATYNNTIIVGDYKEGLDPENIKWSYWGVTGYTGASVSLGINSAAFYDLGTKLIYRYFTFGPLAGRHGIDTTMTQDFNNRPITWYVMTNVLGDGETVGLFKRFRVNINGSGSVVFRLYGKDDVTVHPDITHALAAAPGRFYWYLTNLISESCRILVANLGATKGELIDLSVDHEMQWDERPRT